MKGRKFVRIVITLELHDLLVEPCVHVQIGTGGDKLAEQFSAHRRQQKDEREKFQSVLGCLGAWLSLFSNLVKIAI